MCTILEKARYILSIPIYLPIVAGEVSDLEQAVTDTTEMNKPSSKITYFKG